MKNSGDDRMKEVKLDIENNNCLKKVTFGSSVIINSILRRNSLSPNYEDTSDADLKVKSDTSLISNTSSGRFEKQLPKIPCKSIVLAIILMTLGFLLLIIGLLSLSGDLPFFQISRCWPFFVFGIIMFIPGFYHVRIACFAFAKRPGYTFDQIPGFG